MVTAAPPATRGLKVGELAKQTGLTVRTLHYYDEIGLLSPSAHTATGYRLYTPGDIVRLQQIKSLRQLGWGLEEIRTALDSPAFSPQRVIQLHLARLRVQIGLQQQLCRRLERLAANFRSVADVPVAEFITTIEEITQLENHFTPEQMAEIQERGRQLGEAHIRAVEAEWPVLIADVRAEMEKGTDPADPRVQALARRWMELVNEFSGNNPEIERVLQHRYETEPELQQMTGIDPALMQYASRAMAAAKPGA